MKVLYCSYEVTPFYKVGGLGDVAGSLPAALKELGVDIRILMPFYDKTEEILKGLGKRPQKKLRFAVEFAGRSERVEVFLTSLPKSQVPVYLLRNKRYLAFEKAGRKRIEQWVFFSLSAAKFLGEDYWKADLVHLNDWHTSLVSLFLGGEKPAILTIHNLAYQTPVKSAFLKKLLGPSFSEKRLQSGEDDHEVNILRRGIVLADMVNTVSPTYAKEILTHRFGEGLEGVLNSKKSRLFGILNGIDYDLWDTGTDRALGFRYSRKNWEEGKRKNKLILQREIGLFQKNLPLVGIVTRLAEHKGLDLLLGQVEGKSVLEKILAMGFQVVVLGQGDKSYVKKLKHLKKKLGSSDFQFLERFDDRLARLIYAGADFLLMPSRFEPCGLVQLIAMRYGALPVVHRTGGLADTVREGQNGFVFENYSVRSLLGAMEEALSLSFKTKETMVEKAMGEDFSWRSSARDYLNLYRKTLKLKEMEEK